MEYALERKVPVTPRLGELLSGFWRRWRQAFETYDQRRRGGDFLGLTRGFSHCGPLVTAAGRRVRSARLSFVSVRNWARINAYSNRCGLLERLQDVRKAE